MAGESASWRRARLVSVAVLHDLDVRADDQPARHQILDGFDGSVARSERVANYNQLMRIEEELGSAARYGA
jgi:hypothetical protein